MHPLSFEITNNSQNLDKPVMPALHLLINACSKTAAALCGVVLLDVDSSFIRGDICLNSKENLERQE